jgi:hypothetical protein
MIFAAPARRENSYFGAAREQEAREFHETPARFEIDECRRLH